MATRTHANPAPGHEAWGSRVAPPNRLVRLHRHSLTNALILGGTAAVRTRWALAFHRESPLRLGALVHIDCATDEDRLQNALRDVSSGVSVPDATLIAAHHGTLFLDSVDRLSIETQRLLLPLAAAPAHASRPASSVGRLICGSAARLDVACAAGRFLFELYDALDKIRVDLNQPVEGAA